MTKKLTRRNLEIDNEHLRAECARLTGEVAGLRFAVESAQKTLQLVPPYAPSTPVPFVPMLGILPPYVPMDPICHAPTFGDPMKIGGYVAAADGDAGGAWTPAIANPQGMHQTTNVWDLVPKVNMSNACCAGNPFAGSQVVVGQLTVNADGTTTFTNAADGTVSHGTWDPQTILRIDAAPWEMNPPPVAPTVQDGSTFVAGGPPRSGVVFGGHASSSTAH